MHNGRGHFRRQTTMPKRSGLERFHSPMSRRNGQIPVNAPTNTDEKPPDSAGGFLYVLVGSDHHGLFSSAVRYLRPVP